MTPEELAPDLRHARALIEHLTGSADSPVTFQTFGDSEEKDKSLARILNGTLVERAAELERLNAAGAGIFITVNETDLRGREKLNIVAVRAVFADFDHGAPARFALTPTFTIQSVRGPHAYWCLKPGVALKEFEAAQEQIAAFYDSDTRVKDLPRVMRLPGFYHRKAEPFLVTFAGGSLERYELEQVLAAHPVKGSKAARATERPRVDPAAILAGVPEGDRDNSLWRYACSLRARWSSQAEAETLVLAAARGCSPPFLDREALRKVERAWEYPAGTDGSREAAKAPAVISARGASPVAAPLEHLTDVSNAKLFVAQHHADIRYVYDARRWYIFDGCRWTPDASGHVERLAKLTVESLFQIAAAEPNEERRDKIRRHAIRSQDGHKIESLLKLARSEREVAITSADFDTDPWLLNCPNGTIDLRSGVLRPHNRAEMLTKLAPVSFDPEAESPIWTRFLERIIPDNPDLRAFLQRAFGYSLTGDTSEQKLFVPWGSGANGKSTFLRTGQAVLGDYAISTSIETLIVKRGSGASNDVARLAGARLVSAVEAEEGQRLAEERVKHLTGGDSIAARFLYAEHFEFRPTFKLWLATNHRPHIRGTDEAIWRRIDLIPFTVSIPEPERDRKLPEKLLAELPGILAWAVAGCLRWQAHGLQEPDEVRQATADYRREEDVIGDFLEECCYLEPAASTSSQEIYQTYKEWCQRAGVRTPLTQMALGGKLRERDLLPARDSTTGRKLWRGIGLEPTAGSAA